MIYHPLSFYTEKILTRTPYCSSLFGDGEFIVMQPQYIGQLLTPRHERITKQMHGEMIMALFESGENYLFGSEEALVIDAAKRLPTKLARRIASISFIDGVIWDRSSREGTLAPFLAALHNRDTILVSNPLLHTLTTLLHHRSTISIPPRNAYSEIDRVEEDCLFATKNIPNPVFLLCAGLMSIPLISRLRKSLPYATLLDLGSSLDIFVGLGEERGWRQELYTDPVAYNKTIENNSLDVCPINCPKRI